jgi:hypothetical protein
MTTNIIIQDFLILTGCVAMGMFSIWRSHVNFTKGYVRLGYVYLIIFLLACLIFWAQSFYNEL